MTTKPNLHTDACEGDLQGRKLAIHNWLSLESYWCNCVIHQQRAFWKDPYSKRSGWMCCNCLGLTSHND